MCWFGRLNVKNKNVLYKVVTVCGKFVDERQEHLSQLYERRVVRKARVIVDDNMYMSLLNVTRFFHLVDDFAYLNLKQCRQSIAFLNR